MTTFDITLEVDIYFSAKKIDTLLKVITPSKAKPMTHGCLPLTPTKPMTNFVTLNK